MNQKEMTSRWKETKETRVTTNTAGEVSVSFESLWNDCPLSIKLLLNGKLRNECLLAQNGYTYLWWLEDTLILLYVCRFRNGKTVETTNSHTNLSFSLMMQKDSLGGWYVLYCDDRWESVYMLGWYRVNIVLTNPAPSPLNYEMTLIVFSAEIR